jgi:hypothetical protein
MDLAPATLTERLGPLPVWVWGAAAGGGILAYQYVRQRRAGPATAPSAALTTAAPAASPSVPATSSADGSFFAGGTYTPGSGGNGAYGSPVTATAGPAAITDNDEWIRAATTLVAASNSGLGIIQIGEALKAYIDGRPVTEQQAAIIELALRTSAGQPPYAAPPIQIIATINTPTPVLNPPPPTPAPAPPTPAPAPTRGPWDWLPANLSGWRFVKGSGPEIFEIVPLGLVRMTSWQMYLDHGGSIGPGATTGGNTIVIGDAQLSTLPIIG